MPQALYTTIGGILVVLLCNSPTKASILHLETSGEIQQMRVDGALDGSNESNVGQRESGGFSDIIATGSHLSSPVATAPLAPNCCPFDTRSGAVCSFEAWVENPALDRLLKPPRIVAQRSRATTS